MEPKINLALLESYLRVTGQTELIFNLLLSQYTTKVDDVHVEYSPEISMLALAFISTRREWSTYSCMLYSTSDRLTIAITDESRDVFKLHIDKEYAVVTQPELGCTYPTNNEQDIIELLGDIVADAPGLNAPLEDIQEIIEMLTYVQSLAFPHHPLDPFEILELRRDQLEKIVEDIKSTMTRFEKPEQVVPDDIDEGDLTQTPEQIKQFYDSLPDDEKADSDPTPSLKQIGQGFITMMDENDDNESPVFDLEGTRQKLTRLSEIAYKVQEQTGQDILIDTENSDTLILSKEYDKGLVLTYVLQIIKDSALTMNLTTNLDGIQQLAKSIDTTSTESFVETIVRTTRDQRAFTQATEKTQAGDDLAMFIAQITSVMLSGANPEDIHLPQEDITPPSENDETMTKIWEKAKDMFPDTLKLFNESRQVKIAERVGTHIPYYPTSPFEDTVGFTVSSFPEFISVGYASDLIRNSKIHTVERHVGFVEEYINELVSVNWDEEVLTNMSITPSKNKANWVTSYGINKVLAKQLHSYGEVVDHSGDNYEFNPKLPATITLSELRNYVNNNKILANIKPGLTTFNELSDDGLTTTLHYLNVPHQNALDSSGSRLIMYIENTEQKITVVPIYTVGTTNVVDSINSFSFIRESTWPKLILYLDNVLKTTTTTDTP